MIEFPDLEIRNEDQLVAEAVSRTSGGLTEDIVSAQIRERQGLLKQIQAGVPVPICPELTNANPSAPHTVILEVFGWALAQQARRFNLVPRQNFIAFANLFGITPIPATAARTTLEFTVDPPADTDVTIPEGAQVSDADRKYVFETEEEIVIPFGTPTGEVTARRSVAGHTLLSPGILTELADPIAFVTAVTNPEAVDSGTEVEPLESTLDRVRRYQRRGERIVSTKDLEDAIREEALDGNGVVRAFPFIKNGEFLTSKPLVGHTTVIVMTSDGDAIDSIAKAKIGGLLEQAVGNQYIYVVDPFFVEFDIAVRIKVNTGSPEGAVLAAVEANLRAFYAPSREQFGRGIFRSEIIAVIEGTAGVDHIEPFLITQFVQQSQILESPAADIKLLEYQIPKLVNVTITAV